jgi:hypothetical protein
VTKAEFEKLRADASAYGVSVGVSVVLQMVNTQRSSFTPSGARILLRVIRLVPGETPREYSPTHGYRPDARDLWERIRADIRTAAERLRATNSSMP